MIYSSKIDDRKLELFILVEGTRILNILIHERRNKAESGTCNYQNYMVDRYFLTII